jgi:CelD/BcsL family acetyltransferase involved in cellulose biosynthesis
MKLDVHSDPAAIGSLASEWNTLLAATAHNTIFGTPEWASTWWRSFGEGRSLCIITVRDGGALLGLAPLYVEREGDRLLARFLGGVDVTDYEDIIARPGAEDGVWQEALAYLDQQPWQIDLHNVPGSSATIRFFRQLGQAGRHSVTIEREDVCPVIDPLPPDWESYLEGLDKRNRHELRRKLRRLNDPDLETVTTWRQAELGPAMADFVRLHKLSSADKSEFMTPRMIGFFNNVAQMCHERGWLCLGFMTVQGKRVSTIMAFEYGDGFYLYNSGYDPAYDDLSVGLLLKAQAIEYAITSGKRVYDFLQGSERYKYDLGGRNTEVYQIHCVRK